MQISLVNQRILVTGASRGIGRAIAQQLSASEAEVILHYNANEEAGDFNTVGSVVDKVKGLIADAPAAAKA